MKVQKVLNNSLVLTTDKFGTECILMGKGIGFSLKVGDVVDKDKIEKTYQLNDQDLTKKMIQLSQTTEEVYFNIANQIITYAKEKLLLQVPDYIYPSLTDHISFAVQRYREDVQLQLFELTTLKLLNPKEYQVGEYTLDVIKKDLGIALDLQEIGAIAMHFVNAQTNEAVLDKKLKINKIVKDILIIIQYHFALIYQKESFSYTRMVTHLQLFAIRILDNKQDIPDTNTFLYEYLASNLRNANECMDKIEKYTLKNYGILISSQEKMYLLLHIQRLLESLETE